MIDGDDEESITYWSIHNKFWFVDDYETSFVTKPIGIIKTDHKYAMRCDVIKERPCFSQHDWSAKTFSF